MLEWVMWYTISPHLTCSEVRIGWTLLSVVVSIVPIQQGNLVKENNVVKLAAAIIIIEKYMSCQTAVCPVVVKSQTSWVWNSALSITSYRPRASYFTFLYLTFFIWKIDTMIVPISWSSCEIYMNKSMWNV